MDIRDELKMYRENGKKKTFDVIQKQIKELEDKRYILSVQDICIELDKKISEGFFPQKSYVKLTSSIDHDIGNIISIIQSNNIEKYAGKDYSPQYDVLQKNLKNFAIPDEVQDIFPHRSVFQLELDFPVSDKLKNLLLTSEMKTSLHNAGLELDLPQKSEMKKHKI